MNTLKKTLVTLLYFFTVAATAQVGTCELPPRNKEAPIISENEISNISPSAEQFDIKQAFPMATDIHAQELRFTPNTPLYTGEITAAESMSMLENLGRFSSLAKGSLEALGPVFDIATLGMWAYDLEKTFSDANSNAYEKSASAFLFGTWLKRCFA